MVKKYFLIYLVKKHFTGCLASEWKKITTKRFTILASTGSFSLFNSVFSIDSWSSTVSDCKKVFIHSFSAESNKYIEDMLRTLWSYIVYNGQCLWLTSSSLHAGSGFELTGEVSRTVFSVHNQ